MDDIVVIGMGLRFPGSAVDVHNFWESLIRGESQWSEVPKDRFNVDSFYHPDSNRQGSIPYRGAHFLREDIAAFDNSFFSISAEEARAMDPQQRLLLEVCYEAFENAGLRKEDLRGTETGVYVGSFVKDYEQICLRDLDHQAQYAATGNGTAILANRISHFFDLRGPSMTLDTGCSGSLVSVHLAVQSLKSRESTLAIAAGAGMIISPDTNVPMSAMNFLSSTGKCFTFDARADGYGRGEGIGVVILKRLSDALRDNDPIRAVIRGSRVGQDGHTTGITLPSQEAQAMNIRALYLSNGLNLNETAYVECHGTGTQAGDWRELKAISETLSLERRHGCPVIVGSVKPNIGHLEGAAGIASLIKSVLVLENGKIPPNINFETGNPLIRFEDWKVLVPQDVMEWPQNTRRRVSVNSFGYGGTNAHVVLDEISEYLAQRRECHDPLLLNIPQRDPNQNQDGVRSNFQHTTRLFCFSSQQLSGLRKTLKAHVDYLLRTQGGASSNLLDDYAYTLGARRSNLEWKTFTLASSLPDLLAKLQSPDLEYFSRSSIIGQPRLCFAFGGQGSQLAEMGKSLLDFPIFQESVLSASKYLMSKMGSSFNLLDELLKPAKSSQLIVPEICQPAITVVQVALIELLASFQIRAQYVIGHSSGEIAAAFASGAITRETAWQIAYYRGKATAALSCKPQHIQGAMLAVRMSQEDAQSYLQSTESPVEVACVNSGQSVTLSGAVDAIEAVSFYLNQQRIFHRRLSVRIAYHSSQMDEIAQRYGGLLDQVHFESVSDGVKWFSSVTGSVKNNTPDKAYWLANLIYPVQFYAACKALFSLPDDTGPHVVVELSPRTVLRSPILDILGEIGRSTPIDNCTPNRDSITQVEPFLNLVGSLWGRGFPVDLKSFVTSASSKEAQPKCLSGVPSYGWDHSYSYWHESSMARFHRLKGNGRMDLLGTPTYGPCPFEWGWRGYLRNKENPWLKDHKFQNSIVFPAAGIITMVIEATRQIAQDQSTIQGFEVFSMNITRPMTIPTTNEGLETYLSIKIETPTDKPDQAPDFGSFSLYSRLHGDQWRRHVTGSVQICHANGYWTKAMETFESQYAACKKICNEGMAPRQLYELLNAVGLSYGSTYRNLKQLYTGVSSCVGELQVPDTRTRMPANFEYPYIVHPATMDSMLHMALAIEPSPMLPYQIDKVFVGLKPPAQVGSLYKGYATADRRRNHGVSASVFMSHIDATGPYVALEGIHLRSTAIDTPSGLGFLPNHRNLCSEIVWKEDVDFADPTNLRDLVILLAHKYPDLAILQVGGRCLSMISLVGQLLPESGRVPWFSKYAIAMRHGDDRSTLDHETFKGSGLEPFVDTVYLNEQSPRPTYHLIVRFEDADFAAQDLQKFLFPGGALVSAKEMDKPAIAPRGQLNEEMSRDLVKAYKAPVLDPGETLQVVLLVSGMDNAEIQSLWTNLQDLAGTTNLTPHPLIYTREGIVSRDIRVLEGKMVILLPDTLRPSPGGQDACLSNESDFNFLRNIYNASQGLLLVTHGAQVHPSEPSMAPIIGLARTLRSENPAKAVITLDLDHKTSLGERHVTNCFLHIFRNHCLAQGTFRPSEQEYGEANGRLYIPRLVPLDAWNKMLESDKFAETDAQYVCFHGKSPECQDSFVKLDRASHGKEPTFTRAQTRRLEPLEVEIELHAIYLAHQDTNEQGYAVGSIGNDIKGRVRRFGADVARVQIGQEVHALVPSGGSFGSLVVTAEDLVTSSRVPFIPTHHISAYYSLVFMSRLSSRCKVLLHAAASAMGLAALDVAKCTGAEIFATVIGAGKGEQRQRLLSSGLDDFHILAADKDVFVSEISQRTANTGVDVVYNPFANSATDLVKCLKPGGFFVQQSRGTQAPKAEGVPGIVGGYVTVNIGQLMQDHMELVIRLFKATINFLEDHSTTPSVQKGQVFGIDELGKALEYSTTHHVSGAITISAAPEREQRVLVRPESTIESLKRDLRVDATYVLAGGLGGLGLSIVHLLLSHGARYFVMLSRSGTDSNKGTKSVEKLQQNGAIIKICRVDICDYDMLQQAVSETLVEMPPICGVFNCASVIKDAVFDNMGHADWLAAFNPKVTGSSNLVQVFTQLNTDPFFIFLASSSGVIGNRGQSNYAAGNCFQDSLAHMCRLEGRRAISLDLGPVLGAGMLAQDDQVLNSLLASGFYGIRHSDFIKVLEHSVTLAIRRDASLPAQVVMGIGTGGLIQQNQPADPYWSRTAIYSYLNRVDMPPPGSSLGAESNAVAMDAAYALAHCAERTQATEIIRKCLVEVLAKSMDIRPELVDVDQPPHALGMDSLVAVAVRNWVFSSCGVQISIFELLSDESIAELAEEIQKKRSLKGTNETLVTPIK